MSQVVPEILQRVHGFGREAAPDRALDDHPVEATLRPRPAASRSAARVRVDGKFFRLGDSKFWVKGVTYGPFAPRPASDIQLPPQHQIEADFRLLRGLGANTIRVYHVPPRGLLDTAQAFGLKVLVDVPWSKHRCFLEDADDRETGRRNVRAAARACAEHPALLAYSVVNEIPADVVRWLGPRRVEAFIDELVEIVRQEDPAGLVTFASFPPTEYLHPRGVDFYTMNVYLHKREKFRGYLQRLQNQADEKPLILGEYGIDSLRNGDIEQAELLGMHVEEVFGNGLAGTCVFAFTDEWFTGGQAITDWAFGLVRRDRSTKPAFHTVAEVYRREDPLPALPRYPKVSVLVCTYNGSKTLDGALESLTRLNYPDYEVILVDDGSTDRVPEIAARFPTVRYHRQANRGLSAARNVALELATGEIVAYTDDDCFADRDWLYFLVSKLLSTEASGVGGPNLLPTNDGPVAACVQASPGAPAHILIDDNVAEHVPGCNMAFWRERLLALGGFDALYTKAGDDVDVCWRLQGEGERILYAPAAMVWHHRRSTVRAYLKQQRGYGEAEALLKRKHPEKFRGYRTHWAGRIYTRAGLGLNAGAPIIHHGVFGAGMFQTIYSPPQMWWPLAALSLDWWLGALMLLGLSIFANPLAWLSRVGVLAFDLGTPLLNPLLLLPLGMLAMTAGVAFVAAGQSTPRGEQRRWWSRLLIAALHVAQPVERGWARYRTRFEDIRIPDVVHRLRRAWEARGGKLLRGDELALWSESWIGREELLKELLDLARTHHWFVRVDSGWLPNDVRFYGDRWCKADLVTVTENHGGPRRLTRVRLKQRATLFQKALLLALGYLFVLAWAAAPSAALYVAPFLLLMVGRVFASERQLRGAVMAAVLTSARQLGMTVVGAPDLLARRVPERVETEEAPLPLAARWAASLSWRRLASAARRVTMSLF